VFAFTVLFKHIQNLCKTIIMTDKHEQFQISQQSHQEFIDHGHVLALERCAIVQCGIAKAREMYNIHRRAAQIHMLLYTVQGKGWLESNGQRYLLEPNSLIVVPAGCENSYGIEEQDWQLAWVLLSTRRSWPELVGKEISYCVSPSAEIMYLSIQTLLRSKALPCSPGQQIGQKSVEQIQLLLNAPTQLHLSRAQMRLNKAFERVLQQLHRDWDLASMAALIPCSAPHFHRLCQQYFGHAPKVHLTRMRMEHAGRLLTATDWPIQQICEMVGYPNPANFSTRFKTWSGITPRQFRVSFLSL
jgi:AraC-like DNA-binding protein/quercetin dioxygenase-like cupin family protein